MQKYDDTENSAVPLAWTPEQRLELARELWDWAPHDGQREFLTLRLDDGSEPRVLVAACGRRWGKTEALGMDVAARLLTEPELGQMGVAPTRDQAAGLFDSVEEKLRDAQENPEAVARFPHLPLLEIRQSPYPHIRRKDTGQMVFSVRAAAGRGGRNLRGRGTTRKLKRFRVIVDERAFVDDAAVEEAIKPMLATIPGGGGQLVMISTPYGKRGGFYHDYLRGERKEKRVRSVRLPSSQNPLVDPEFLEAMQAEMTPTRFATEFLAEFHDRAGTVFADDDITAALCPDDYGDAPLWGCRYVGGVDFGRRADYTVICVLEVIGNRLRLVEMKRLQGLTWNGQIETLCETIARWKLCRVTTDATGNGDALTENLGNMLREKRLPCVVDPFIFSVTSKPRIIDGLVLALAQRRLRFPPHPVLLSELHSFEATPSETGHRETLEAARGAHDDTVCALALAHQSALPLLAPGAGSSIRIALGGSRRSYTDTIETEFSPCPTYSPPCRRPLSLLPRAAFSRVSASLRRRHCRRLPLLLLLTAAYRFAPLRRAGAFLRRCCRYRRSIPGATGRRIRRED